MAKAQPVIPLERIASRICLIRGEKVMLDSDLAELYQVETKNLNKAVKRILAVFRKISCSRLQRGKLNL